jgi:hypothetical protein
LRKLASSSAGHEGTCAGARPRARVLREEPDGIQYIQSHPAARDHGRDWCRAGRRSCRGGAGVNRIGRAGHDQDGDDVLDVQSVERIQLELVGGIELGDTGVIDPSLHAHGQLERHEQLVEAGQVRLPCD